MISQGPINTVGQGRRKGRCQQSRIGQEEEEFRDRVNKNPWWISEPEFSFLVLFVGQICVNRGGPNSIGRLREREAVPMKTMSLEVGKIPKPQADP